MEEKSVVLNRLQIRQKIERISFQIYENTFDQGTLFIIGIAGNGFVLAERILAQLKTISDQQIKLIKITINKEKPLADDILLSIEDADLKNATIVMVDDVINSGRTMIYAVKRILRQEIREIKVVTLVNRTHRRYPVKADYVGLNISTTLKDKIVVEFGENECAYLN
jgi:pyrimidine operon attenuation protein/uracil phosphoribosyltransferase